jgi:hypothetical protein
MTLLDQFLTEADIDPSSKCVGDMLEADQVYVTSSTIKSQKFTILPEAEKGSTLNLNIPEIQKTVGGNVKVSSNSKYSSAITFEGDTPLVFGFQAWQLFYNKGKISRIEPVQKVTLAGPKSKSNLLGTNPFLSFNQ